MKRIASQRSPGCANDVVFISVAFSSVLQISSATLIKILWTKKSKRTCKHEISKAPLHKCRMTTYPAIVLLEIQSMLDSSTSGLFSDISLTCGNVLNQTAKAVNSSLSSLLMASGSNQRPAGSKSRAHSYDLRQPHALVQFLLVRTYDICSMLKRSRSFNNGDKLQYVACNSDFLLIQQLVQKTTTNHKNCAVARFEFWEF